MGSCVATALDWWNYSDRKHSLCLLDGKSMFIQSQQGEKGRFRHCSTESSRPICLILKQSLFCSFILFIFTRLALWCSIQIKWHLMCWFHLCLCFLSVGRLCLQSGSLSKVWGCCGGIKSDWITAFGGPGSFSVSVLISFLVLIYLMLLLLTVYIISHVKVFF